MTWSEERDREHMAELRTRVQAGEQHVRRAGQVNDRTMDMLPSESATAWYRRVTEARGQHGLRIANGRTSARQPDVEATRTRAAKHNARLTELLVVKANARADRIAAEATARGLHVVTTHATAAA